MIGEVVAGTLATVAGAGIVALLALTKPFFARVLNNPEHLLKHGQAVSGVGATALVTVLSVLLGLLALPIPVAWRYLQGVAERARSEPVEHDQLRGILDWFIATPAPRWQHFLLLLPVLVTGLFYSALAEHAEDSEHPGSARTARVLLSALSIASAFAVVYGAVRLHGRVDADLRADRPDGTALFLLFEDDVRGIPWGWEWTAAGTSLVATALLAYLCFRLLTSQAAAEAFRSTTTAD